MHNSQPVHSEAITVCINFAAPTIASTGQAAIHLTQPMQSFSIINATLGGLVQAEFGIQRLGGDA